MSKTLTEAVTKLTRYECYAYESLHDSPHPMADMRPEIGGDYVRLDDVIALLAEAREEPAVEDIVEAALPPEAGRNSETRKFIPAEAVHELRDEMATYGEKVYHYIPIAHVVKRLNALLSPTRKARPLPLTPDGKIDLDKAVEEGMAEVHAHKKPQEAQRLLKERIHDAFTIGPEEMFAKPQEARPIEDRSHCPHCEGSIQGNECPGIIRPPARDEPWLRDEVRHILYRIEHFNGLGDILGQTESDLRSALARPAPDALRQAEAILRRLVERWDAGEYGPEYVASYNAIADAHEFLKRTALARREPNKEKR